MTWHDTTLMEERLPLIMEAIKSGIETDGYAPTVREIGDVAKIPSTSMVKFYLDRLEDMGEIERDRNVSRGIRLKKFRIQLVPIDLVTNPITT